MGSKYPIFPRWARGGGDTTVLGKMTVLTEFLSKYLEMVSLCCLNILKWPVSNALRVKNADVLGKNVPLNI